MPKDAIPDRYTGGQPCPGIAPHKGWSLFEADEWDGEGFLTPTYFARGPVRDVHLNHSRFAFEPTDARFAWLVDHEFGRGLKVCSPFNSDDIDAAIERAAAAGDRAPWLALVA